MPPRTEKWGDGGDRDSSADGEAWDDAAVDAECQKRLVAYLETVKASMTKVLDDTFLLTEDVTKTMQLVSAPARRSRSTNGATSATVAVRKTPSNESAAAGASTPPPVSHPMRRAPCAVSRPKPSPSAVAHVSPRVGGHAIHKPQIEIQRLGMDEIARYQEEQERRRREREEREREPAEDQEEEEEEEDEPLAPRNNEGEDEEDEGAIAEEDLPAVEQRASRSSRYSRYRMSIIGEESEEHTEEEVGEEEDPDSSPLPPPPSDRARRRRQRRRRTLINSSFQDLGSPVVLLQDASALLEQYNLSTSRIQDEEDEDTEAVDEPADAAEPDEGGAQGGSARRQKTPTRRPSKKVSFAQAMSPAKETVLLLPRLVLERVTTTETPRARESNEEFFRRLSGIDAMEGPSWLFNESAAGSGRHSDHRQSGQRQSVQRQSDQRQSDQRQSANGTSELRESDAGSRKRSSRAAASAASYKEPSLNKKMRQGDPNSASVYKDYVPQTKAKKKSSGGKEIQKKKSSEGNGRNKKNPKK